MLRYFSIKKKTKPLKLNTSILEIIWHIIKDDHFKELRRIRHHMFFNRYEHLINTATLSYRFAKFFKADVSTCVIAAILHDFHFTTIKSPKHWILAAKNSEKFWVTEEIKNIICSHMYPLWIWNIVRPKWINFWIVTAADKIAAIYEITYCILNLKFNYKKIKFKKTKTLLENLEKQFPIIEQIENKLKH